MRTFVQKPNAAQPTTSDIQAQLRVGPPGDSHEQEADRVSEQVMRIQPGHDHVPTKHVRAGEPGPMAPPPIVHDVLRSPGRPLEPAARDFMEPRFGHDFGRIRIHTDPPAARAAEALGAEAFTVGHHIAFARDRFLPATAPGKRLVAHELTHTIQQAATSPYIALAPKKKSAPGSSKLDGVLLGTNRKKEEVRVKREVGGTQGYDDRLQAIAVARLAKAEPAAVVLGTDGKWHAVETTAAFDVGLVSADPKAVPFTEVHGLPSRAGIDQAPPKDEDLKAKQARAARIFGVAESEILLIGSLSSRVAGKINIVGSPGRGSPGGGHNPLGGETGFEEGRVSAVHIDLPELDNPARAQSVLFHEVQHLKDWELAQTWVKNYTTETRRLFVKGAPGQKPFKEWLDAQVKKNRLTRADVELVIMQTADASAYTEARANVRTFLAALQAGAPDEATKLLVGYAHALKPKKEGGGGQYASPAYKSEVQAALVKELKTAYGQMSTTMKQQYDAAVAAAKNEYPGAWISELDFSKPAGK